MLKKTLTRIAVSVTVSTAGMIHGSAATPMPVANSVKGTPLRRTAKENQPVTATAPTTGLPRVNLVYHP